MSSFSDPLSAFPLKVVLTGGPGVGKTSILRRLCVLGYDVREEVFTELFAEADKKGSVESLFIYPEKLLHDLVMRQYEIESSPSRGKIIFYDRSMIDIIGFARNLNLEITSADLRYVDQGHYDAVFIVEPLAEVHYVKNSIRRQTYLESLDHHSRLIDVYKSYSVQNKRSDDFLTVVPNLGISLGGTPLKSAVADLIQIRTQWILDRLTLGRGN